MDNKKKNRPKAFDNVHVQFLSTNKYLKDEIVFASTASHSIAELL